MGQDVLENNYSIRKSHLLRIFYFSDAQHVDFFMVIQALPFTEEGKLARGDYQNC